MLIACDKFVIQGRRVDLAIVSTCTCRSLNPSYVYGERSGRRIRVRK